MAMKLEDGLDVMVCPKCKEILRKQNYLILWCRCGYLYSNHKGVYIDLED